MLVYENIIININEENNSKENKLNNQKIFTNGRNSLKKIFVKAISAVFMV